jgi:hypothetical protein
MRGNKQDNEANIIDGDVVIGELIKANMVLLPFAIDPHSRWGPILQHFLSLTKPWTTTFLNINQMHEICLQSSQCPIGILQTTNSIWKSNKTQHFFGYSYSSPTPSIYTIQQLGLGITKAFTAHIRNTIRLLTTSPLTRQHSTEGPRQSALFLANRALE